MKVEYYDKKLQVLESPQEAHKSKLPVSVIKSFNRKLPVMRNAPSEKTLRNWKSLHFEKLTGDRIGFMSIRLNDQYRVVFKIEHEPEIKIVIYEVCDYHT